MSVFPDDYMEYMDAPPMSDRDIDRGVHTAYNAVEARGRRDPNKPLPPRKQGGKGNHPPAKRTPKVTPGNHNRTPPAVGGQS